MTKKDIIEEVHQRTGLPRVLVRDVLKASLNIIKEHLKRGEEVKIVRFGKWQPLLRKSKRVKHPTTGEMIQIPPYVKVVFKPSQDVKKI